MHVAIESSFDEYNEEFISHQVFLFRVKRAAKEKKCAVKTDTFFPEAFSTLLTVCLTFACAACLTSVQSFSKTCFQSPYVFFHHHQAATPARAMERLEF